MKYFYSESEEEEEDDDQRLKLKEITQIVSVRDVDVETLGPVQQRNPIERPTTWGVRRSWHV